MGNAFRTFFKRLLAFVLMFFNMIAGLFLLLFFVLDFIMDVWCWFLLLMCIVAVHYGCVLLDLVSIDMFDFRGWCVVSIVTIVFNIVSLHSCFSYWFVMAVFNCIFVADCYHCVYVDFMLTFISGFPYFLLMICIIDFINCFHCQRPRHYHHERSARRNARSD